MGAVSPIKTKPKADIDYPDSDGKPMGETDVHVQELANLLQTLQIRYRDAQDVHVAGNSFIYYEEGNRRARFSPDVYVVFGVPKRLRRIYKLWEEGQPPSAVFEFTSRSTMLEDRGNKKALCENLGVHEYFLCDPLAEYLRPPLQGFRLTDGWYRPIEPDDQGWLHSATLDVTLRLENAQLLLTDAATGQRLLRPLEADQALRQEAEARRQAEARAAEAEAELDRLRAELARLRGSSEE
ncbi:MAG: Uma2 family endonuclease [Anaerolineae bacterium]|nr:Uma2 family endonuclease [Anaerolineae bacterium]